MAMELQEIFDKVRSHLLTQNARAMIGGTCAYRGEDSMSCAVGCLIADSAYITPLEGRGMDAAIVQEALLRSGIIPTVFCGGTPSDHISLLVMLQDIHDRVPVKDWEYRLEEIAGNFCLEIKPFNPPIVQESHV